MKRKILYLTALVLIFLTGCSTASPLLLVNPAHPAAVKFDDYQTQMEIREENALTKEFADNLKDFSFASGATIFAAEQGNINYSPVSLYLALALTAEGAKGDTQTQLLNALQVQNMSADDLSEQCARLYRLLYGENEIGRVRPAVSLWLDKGERLTSAFAETAGENYYAEVYSADLQDEKTHQAMGEWIRSKTSGQLAPQMTIAEDTLMTLITCLDFEDQWIDEFRKENNKKGNFTREDGSTLQVEYLCSSYNPYAYYDGEGFIRASLPMKNGNNMVFVLPDEGIPASELARDPDTLKNALSGGREDYGEVIFEIPKFDFTSSFDLKNTVAALGAGSIFGLEADLSGISGKQLFLSGVKQQSRIAVDEKGVSAAAFTEILYAGAAMMQEKVVEMVLDRPFIYAVVAQNGTILFMGVCQVPTEA